MKSDNTPMAGAVSGFTDQIGNFNAVLEKKDVSSSASDLGFNYDS